jgi:hypothetical protein
MDLPSTVYRGKVVRVQSINCIEINLDLRFGVHIDKNVVLEGIEAKDINPKLRSQAMHCLILLVGGKKVIVHADDSQRDGYIVGRVFLQDRVTEAPVPLLRPYGMDTPMLEVTSFYRWMASRDFNAADVTNLLNAKVGAK